MQTDILVKASQFKTLDDVIKQTEALEKATCNQQTLHQPLK